MKLKSAAGFTRRFGIGVRAGGDLIALLKAEAKHGSARQRGAILSLAEAASSGETLTAAMKSQGRFFPPLMIAMTNVGETTGRLEQTMLALADHYDTQVSLRRSFISAITWPCLQLLMAIGVISLLIWLMGILTGPTGAPMMDLLGLGLRGSQGVLQFWGGIAVVAGLLWAGYFAFNRNFLGVQNLIPLFYLIPVVGPSLQTITLARFSWTLSLALESGIDPIRSVSMSLDSTASDFYRSGAETSEKQIRSGSTLAQALDATDVFPEEFISRIEVAELTGTDAESISHLANEYDERAKLAMSALGRLASGTVWVLILLIMLYFIVSMLMKVLGAYSAATSDLL